MNDKMRQQAESIGLDPVQHAHVIAAALGSEPASLAHLSVAHAKRASSSEEIDGFLDDAAAKVKSLVLAAADVCRTIEQAAEDMGHEPPKFVVEVLKLVEILAQRLDSSEGH
jgi:hypothetical protein